MSDSFSSSFRVFRGDTRVDDSALLPHFRFDFWDKGGAVDDDVDGLLELGLLLGCFGGSSSPDEMEISGFSGAVYL